MDESVSLAELDDLAAALVAAGVRSADRNPEKVKLPGVWIQPTGFDLGRLAGYDINVRLLLLVPDNGYARSQAELVELLNKVLTVVNATETITAQTAILPGAAQKPLPGLAVPTVIACDY